MKNIFFPLFLQFSFFSAHCFSQGGWDIGYIEKDSINTSIIGKDVKLDFASNDNILRSFFLMDIISKSDTAVILIDGQLIQIIEKRKIYDDWGFYSEQYLECSNYNNNQILKIYHSVVEDVNDTAIKIRVYIEVYRKDKETNEKSPTHWCSSIWIERRELNGLMVKL